MASPKDSIYSIPAFKDQDSSLFKKLSAIPNSMAVRYITISLISAVIALVATDMVYLSFSEASIQKLSERFVSSPAAMEKFKTTLDDELWKSHSIYYWAIAKDGAITASSKGFEKDSKVLENKKSGVLEYRNSKVFDSVISMKDGSTVHLGHFAGDSAFRLLLGAKDGWHYSIPVQYMVCFFLLYIATTGLLLHFTIAVPLAHLARCSRALLKMDEPTREAAMSLPYSPSELQTLATSLGGIKDQFDAYVAKRLTKEHSLNKERQTVEFEKTKLEKQFEQHQLVANQSISELSTKESEDEFLSALSIDIDNQTSSTKICQTVLDKLNDKYPRSITRGAFFLYGKDNVLRVTGYTGFTEGALRHIKESNHENICQATMSSGKTLSFGPQELHRYNLESLEELEEIQNFSYSPIKYQDKPIGLLAIFFEVTKKTAMDRARIIRKVSDLTGRCLYRVQMLTEELESARTDALTGLYNKKFFYELAPKLFDRAGSVPEDHPVSFLLVDGDRFKDINDTFGHQAGDEVLRKLGEVLRINTRMKDSEQERRFKDYVIRFGGEEFLIILENTPPDKAKLVAERIRRAVEDKVDWSHGIAKWTVSLGVSCFPFDGRDIDRLLLQADRALYYVKQVKNRNAVCMTEDVPEDFRKFKAASLDGELGVFEPSSLLQSIATSRKTGVLTVQTNAGKQFWLMFDTGKPTQARLGRLSGVDAIIDFVCLFQDGKFEFQERSLDETGGLPVLDEKYNLEKPLERCLMDAALAQDNLQTAKIIVPDITAMVCCIEKELAREKWKAALKLADPPTDSERKVMKRIVALSSDPIRLSSIFNEINDLSTVVLWRAAALLIKYGILDLVTSDVEKEKTASTS